MIDYNLGRRIGTALKNQLKVAILKGLAEVLRAVQGRWLRAVSKTKGTVVPSTDRVRPANNVFTFFPKAGNWFENKF